MFVGSLFLKYIKLILDLLIFILIFSWYAVYFYFIYLNYIEMLFCNRTNIFLIKFAGAWMWVWLVVYNGLPFIWFLISYTYMKVYKTKTLDEATELTLNKEPIAFYIKWLFWIFIKGFKIGQENYVPKFSAFMTPGDIVFYIFWGSLIQIMIILIFRT